MECFTAFVQNCHELNIYFYFGNFVSISFFFFCLHIFLFFVSLSFNLWLTSDMNDFAVHKQLKIEKQSVSIRQNKQTSNKFLGVDFTFPIRDKSSITFSTIHVEFFVNNFFYYIRWGRLVIPHATRLLSFFLPFFFLTFHLLSGMSFRFPAKVYFFVFLSSILIFKYFIVHLILFTLFLSSNSSGKFLIRFNVSFIIIFLFFSSDNFSITSFDSFLLFLLSKSRASQFLLLFAFSSFLENVVLLFLPIFKSSLSSEHYLFYVICFLSDIHYSTFSFFSF